MTVVPLRVLLVDDVEDVRFLIGRVLKRDERFEVVAEAADGQAAIDAARSHQPDLVLLDLAMPVLDGLSALPGIREAAPSARVVILSGFPEAEMGESAAGNGALGYLEKGLSPRALIDRLVELIEPDAA